MRYSITERDVPKDRLLRVAAIVQFTNYTERMVGGVLTGGATLEEINTWRMLGFDDADEHADVTEDEMHELEGYGLASRSGGVWRCRPKPEATS